MLCPHCKSNETRNAVMRICGDFYCEACMPEVWALMQAARAVIRDADDGGKCELCGRIAAHYTGCTIVSLSEAIAALEVKA